MADAPKLGDLIRDKWNDRYVCETTAALMLLTEEAFEALDSNDHGEEPVDLAQTKVKALKECCDKWLAAVDDDFYENMLDRLGSRSNWDE